MKDVIEKLMMRVPMLKIRGFIIVSRLRRDFDAGTPFDR